MIRYLANPDRERYRGGVWSPALGLELPAQRPPSQRLTVQLDDEVCLCFHVTKRKVRNFLRIEKPRRAGQLSECFGAGTGCGWGREYLRRMHQRWVEGDVEFADDLPAQDHAKGRAGYVRDGGGTPPPGATPIVEQ